MKKDKLTAYEKEIVEAIDRGEYQPVDNVKGEIKRLSVVAQKQMKNKMISLRLPEDSIVTLKENAKKAGLPYQTLISMLIHQYNQGKVNLKI
ncbi:MAG TPA: CopG family antitoxin [Spirochaetia bacterium]|nr:CopG family antitoxin [Spirochaetia bacterium]